MFHPVVVCANTCTNGVLNVLMIHSSSHRTIRRSVGSIMFTQTSKTLCFKLNSVVRHLDDNVDSLKNISTNTTLPVVLYVRFIIVTVHTGDA